jgi:hypothetical protein
MAAIGSVPIGFSSFALLASFVVRTSSVIRGHLTVQGSPRLGLDRNLLDRCVRWSIESALWAGFCNSGWQPDRLRQLPPSGQIGWLHKPSLALRVAGNRESVAGSRAGRREVGVRSHRLDSRLAAKDLRTAFC